MKKMPIVLLAVITVLCILVLPATATPPDDSVAGRWCYGYLEVGEPKVAGESVFYTMDSSDAWIGTFEGFSKSYGRVQEHPAGYTILKTDVFLDPITVGGKTGTLEMKANGWMPTSEEGQPPNYSEYEGTWVITGGTGDLTGLHGQGTWENVEFGNTDCTDIDPGFIASVTYEGQINFAP